MTIDASQIWMRCHGIEQLPLRWQRPGGKWRRCLPGDLLSLLRMADY